MLTIEELRRRRAEIVRVAQKHGVHRIGVFGSAARESLVQTAILTCWSTLNRVLPSLTRLHWSRTLRNFWALGLTWLRDTPSSLGTNAFSRRPWTCDQGSMISSRIC